MAAGTAVFNAYHLIATTLYTDSSTGNTAIGMQDYLDSMQGGNAA